MTDVTNFMTSLDTGHEIFPYNPLLFMPIEHGIYLLAV